MARKSIAERIAQLDAQKKALQARAGKQERANDTRRKVLLGALVLHRLENAGDAEFSKRLGDWLRRELPGFLSREFRQGVVRRSARRFWSRDTVGDDRRLDPASPGERGKQSGECSFEFWSAANLVDRRKAGATARKNHGGDNAVYRGGVAQPPSPTE